MKRGDMRLHSSKTACGADEPVKNWVFAGCGTSVLLRRLCSLRLTSGRGARLGTLHTQSVRSCCKSQEVGCCKVLRVAGRELEAGEENTNIDDWAHGTATGDIEGGWMHGGRPAWLYPIISTHVPLQYRTKLPFPDCSFIPLQ